MYHEFYGLREAPFSLLPDPDFIYPTKKHEAAFSVLQIALENNNGFAVVSGEIGAGKTTLIRLLLASLDKDVTVGLVSNTHASFGSLMDWISEAFGLESAGKSSAELHDQLAHFLIDQYRIGARTLLIIDEAQNLSAETLEELRLISNINSDKDQLLHTILVGQPNLRDTLRGPGMEQFAQRIVTDYHLDGLDEEETVAYIRYRVEHAGGQPELFSSEACQVIYQHSNGIPRRINLLCDTALVYAYGESLEHVDAAIVNSVVQDRSETTIAQGISSMSGPGPAEHLDRVMPVEKEAAPVPEEPVEEVAETAIEMPEIPEPVPVSSTTAEPIPVIDTTGVPASDVRWGRRLDTLSMLLAVTAVVLLWEIRHELGF